jgi:transcriptional regulator with XRE-family HTH domain
MKEQAEINKRLKIFREERKMTLVELAQRTGFSKGYLSKIENTKKAPPVSTLIKLSKVLNVSISEIFGEVPDRDPFCLVKKGERRMMARDGSVLGYAYETLAHKYFNKHMEPFVVTLPASVKKNHVFQHEGEEMVFMLEGNMKVFYGDKEFLVEEGDCLYFNAKVPHHAVCHGRKKVKFLMVIYTPQ